MPDVIFKFLSTARRGFFHTDGEERKLYALVVDFLNHCLTSSSAATKTPWGGDASPRCWRFNAKGVAMKRQQHGDFWKTEMRVTRRDKKRLSPEEGTQPMEMKKCRLSQDSTHLEMDSANLETDNANLERGSTNLGTDGTNLGTGAGRRQRFRFYGRWFSREICGRPLW